MNKEIGGYAKDALQTLLLYLIFSSLAISNIVFLACLQLGAAMSMPFHYDSESDRCHFLAKVFKSWCIMLPTLILFFHDRRHPSLDDFSNLGPRRKSALAL